MKLSFVREPKNNQKYSLRPTFKIALKIIVFTCSLLYHVSYPLMSFIL